MKVEIKKIEKFCQDYLKIKDFEDYCYNGIQVEGCREVEKIITGVSFSLKLIESAINEKAQMIIVHHGLFKNRVDASPKITGVLKGRLKKLLENNISLMGFHLPLDAHPLIGNNASLAKILNIKNLKPVYVGFVGSLEKEMSFKDFVKLVDNKINTKSYSIQAGSNKVKKIGIISGGASPEYVDAKEMGADTYLCGDIREGVVRAVEEAQINFINAGHYNTEKLGIQNLGKLIAKKFKIEVKFIDIPCEI